MMVRGTAGDMVDVVTCGGEDLRGLRRGAVSMVFQQFALLPWRTRGRERGARARARRRAEGEAAGKAREVLATVNLQDWAEKKVSELSGGMQQRVGLARAFATDAEILLMDEPFSALDPLIRNRLQDELLQLQEKMHCTIVFVSHDLEEAVKLGNTITIMEGGRIVQTGKPEDIVLRPANGYVADFVAHLNPLSVLTAADAMTPDVRPWRSGADPGAGPAAAGGASAVRGRGHAGLGGARRCRDRADQPAGGLRDAGAERRRSGRGLIASARARRAGRGQAGGGAYRHRPRGRAPGQ